MVIAALLLIAAFGVAVLGAVLLTNATMGVGFIALACFAGIVARIIQAQVLSRQSREASSSAFSSSTSTS